MYIKNALNQPKKTTESSGLQVPDNETVVINGSKSSNTSNTSKTSDTSDTSSTTKKCHRTASKEFS